MKKALVYGAVVAIAMIIAIVVKYQEQNVRKLPIINPSGVNSALVDSSLHHKGVDHTILNFSLTNQLG